MVLNKKTLLQITLFLFVGGVTFLIDVGVTTLLYNQVNFPAYLASATGFLSGFFFNFPMNRKKVFKHTPQDRFELKTQVILYALLSLFNLAATSLLVDLIVTNNIVTIGYAKIVVTAMIAVWNFMIFKYFIFSKHQKLSQAT